jgi:hypothetical protein
VLVTCVAAIVTVVACEETARHDVRAPAPSVLVTDASIASSPTALQASAATSEAPDAAAAIADAPDAAAATSVADAAPASACNEQQPQDFLVRANFLPKGDAGEIKVRMGRHQQSIQYRTDTYGYFHGFGKPAPGALAPDKFVVDATFMGLPVKMHKKVVPALACVEGEIKRACADHPYTPRALAGIRYNNTYRGGEVTNHAYGIAIDIDPGLNSCCGCVKPWSDAPQCARPAKSEYDRMAMPECWVHAFERYGFYWLGHDVLKDTMHFEFLGDPDKILRQQTAAIASDAGATN